jgi:hypothetical protein
MKKRLTVDYKIGGEFEKNLVYFHKEGMTYAETVRRAIAAYSTLYVDAKKGTKICGERPDGTIKEYIILPR